MAFFPAEQHYDAIVVDDENSVGEPKLGRMDCAEMVPRRHFLVPLGPTGLVAVQNGRDSSEDLAPTFQFEETHTRDKVWPGQTSCADAIEWPSGADEIEWRMVEDIIRIQSVSEIIVIVITTDHDCRVGGWSRKT